MDKIFFIGYEMFTMLFPFGIAYILFHRVYLYHGIKHSVSYSIVIFLFALYICAVFHVTGTGTLYDTLLYGLKIRPEQLNILPFMDDDIDIIAYMLNILLFIPLGFFLPILWVQFRKIKHIIAVGFSFSLLIEISQLLNNRRTDIDDLILNTLGALIGFVILILFAKIFKLFDKEEKCFKYEPIIYIIVMSSGRFFLFYEMRVAKLLYGF